MNSPDIDQETLKRLLIASQLDISNLSLILKNRVDVLDQEKLILQDISERNIQVANILGLNDNSILDDVKDNE